MRGLPRVTVDKSTGNFAYVRRRPRGLESGLPGNRFFRSLDTKDKKALVEPWARANPEYDSMVAEARGETAVFDAKAESVRVMDRREEPLISKVGLRQETAASNANRD